MKGTICLLGPQYSGKSSLMRTMRQCIELGAHGYPPADIASFKLKEITHSEFESGGVAIDDVILTRFPTGGYSDEEAEFLKREAAFDDSGTEQTTKADDGPISYDFSLHWTWGETSTSFPAPEPHLFRLIDAAGELSTPSGPSEQDWERHRKELDKVLIDAHGIILVAPPADGRQESWATYMLQAIENLVQRPSRKLNNIVVVFSQYDRLFIRCGADAASVAVRWYAVQYAIQREFKSRRWLTQLIKLLPDEDENGDKLGIRLRFTVASAFGFSRTFGNSNIDPNANAPSSAMAATEAQRDQFRFRISRGGNLDANQLWRPFLSADPFIFAATGMPSYYMLARDEVADSWAGREQGSTPGGGLHGYADQSQDAQESSPTRWFRRVVQFFNAADNS